MCVVQPVGPRGLRGLNDGGVLLGDFALAVLDRLPEIVVDDAELAEALDHPDDRDAAASAIRGLIERIVLTPGENGAKLDAVLYGDLGTILEWAGNRRQNTKTDI